MTTHCAPARLNARCAWMFGDAIATMVWSMNVIATANSIAASASHFDFAVSVVPTVCDPICPCALSMRSTP